MGLCGVLWALSGTHMVGYSHERGTPQPVGRASGLYQYQPWSGCVMQPRGCV